MAHDGGDDDQLELGSFNEDEMKELMQELEGVDVSDITAEMDTGGQPGTDKAQQRAIEINPVHPDSDFTDGSENLTDTTENTEGPMRVTVETSATSPVESTTDTVADPCAKEEPDGMDDESLQQLSMLETMCDLANKALVTHAEIVAARDSMSAVRGSVCFAPSSVHEMDDVRFVQEVASELPFLFTAQEAQGYLPCNVERRYAAVAIARDLQAICNSINHECAMAVEGLPKGSDSIDDGGDADVVIEGATDDENDESGEGSEVKHGCDSDSGEVLVHSYADLDDEVVSNNV